MLILKVVAGLEAHERCLLLKFVTSCSRAPLLGFKHLQPAFTIHKVILPVCLSDWYVIMGKVSSYLKETILLCRSKIILIHKLGSLQVVCDAPVWAIIGGQDVVRLPSASTCYNTLKVGAHCPPVRLKYNTVREARSHPPFSCIPLIPVFPRYPFMMYLCPLYDCRPFRNYFGDWRLFAKSNVSTAVSWKLSLPVNDACLVVLTVKSVRFIPNA